MKDTHPIELMLVAAIAACTAITWALRAVLVPLVALALTIAGWRPAAAAATPAAGRVVSAAPAPEPTPAAPVAALRKHARKAGHPAAWCRTARKAELLQALAGGSWT